MQSERDKALRRVQAAGFAAHEAALYLDSHPDDEEAMTYFNMQMTAAKEAARQFSAKYGPLTMENAVGANTWEWVKTPWPWEMI